MDKRTVAGRLFLMFMLLCMAMYGQTTFIDVEYEYAGITEFSHTNYEDYLSLYVENEHLYIGAVHTPKDNGEGILFKVKSSNISNLVNFTKFEVVNSTKSGAIPCVLSVTRDKEILCRNFIRVIMNVSTDDLLVCGTNAEVPRCYTVTKTDLTYTGFSGTYKCPAKQDQSVTAVLGEDKKLYTGLVYESDGKIAIARNPITEDLETTDLTTVADAKWLNEAEFISSYSVTKADGTDEILFFFREIAYDNVDPDSQGLRYSRVAKVCEQDKGGNVNFLNNQWTSYLKARLYCADETLVYDFLQDTELIDDKVYAVFTVGRDVPMSALCVYDVKKITGSEVFESKIYRHQESSDKLWVDVDLRSEDPYPGECVIDSNSLSPTLLNKTRHLPLLSGLVESIYPPQLTSYGNVKFTKIVGSEFEGELILYIGTDSGTVMKVLNSNSDQPIVLDVVQVSNNDTNPAVNVMTKSDEDQFLYIGFSDKVVQVPMFQCGRYLNCHTCNGSRDPHCVWDAGECVLNSNQTQSHCQDSDIEIITVEVIYGDTGVASCPVHNGIWYKNDERLEIDNFKYLSVGRVGLCVTNFFEDDNGKYTMETSSGEVICKQGLEIVEVKNEELDDSSQAAVVCENKDLYLYCHVSGPSDITTAWYSADDTEVTDDCIEVTLRLDPPEKIRGCRVKSTQGDQTFRCEAGPKSPMSIKQNFIITVSYEECVDNATIEASIQWEVDYHNHLKNISIWEDTVVKTGTCQESGTNVENVGTCDCICNHP